MSVPLWRGHRIVDPAADDALMVDQGGFKRIDRQDRSVYTADRKLTIKPGTIKTAAWFLLGFKT